MSYKNLEGNTFGRWTVLYEVEPKIDKRNKRIRYWMCRCECGNEKPVQGHSLINGKSKSCGCLHSEIMQDVGHNNKSHGLSDTRLYRIYNHIINRCYNKNDNRYDNYGGRNIRVCEDWLSSFEKFADWAVSNGYDDELSIDRIDVNLNYCPENCRWTDKYTQANNKTNTKVYTFNGETHSIAEWSRIVNIPYKKLWKRFSLGWDIEKALTT